MLNFRIFHDLKELHGTCIVEILPGPFHGKCWNEGSIFVEEETFGLLENIVKRHAPKYSHYAFTEIRRSAWEQILSDFARLVERLRTSEDLVDLGDEVCFLLQSRECFGTSFRSNANALASMLGDLILWLRGQLATYETITVLGI